MPLESEERRAIWKLAGYVLAVVLVCCLALLINVGLVYALYSGLAPLFLSEEVAKRLGQFVLLVGPFLLLFPEWIVYDILVTPFRQTRS